MKDLLKKSVKVFYCYKIHILMKSSTYPILPLYSQPPVLQENNDPPPSFNTPNK